MEVGIVSTLGKHIADAKGQPKVRAALAKHRVETKRHAAEMKKALASLGGSHPYLKEGVSKLTNLVAGLVTTMAKDTAVKNAITDFATEHFEIACYKSLIVTATSLGEKKIAATCRAILREEMAMAKILDGQLAAISEAYLSGLEDEAGDAEPESPQSGGRSRRSKAKKARK